MARSYLPSFFGRDDDPFGSLFREVQKTFEDFSRRSPLAGFGSDTLAPKIDIAESKDAIDLTAELPRREGCRCDTRRRDADHPR
jgi:HSP20 family molecular chaperone IbpA